MAEGVNPELGGTFYRLYYPVDRKGYLPFLAATHSLRSGFNLFLFQYPGFGATRLTSLACFRLRQGYAETRRPRKPLLRDSLASA